MNTKLALFAVAFAAATFDPASAETPSTQEPARQVASRPVKHRIPRAVARARDRGELRRFLKSLDATEAQRAVALEQARAAGPIARGARLEGRQIRIEARHDHPGDRAAARAAARPRIRELRERTLASLQPLSQKILASLAPEQRKKLEDAARARGREFDEARLEKIVSWLLTRPRSLTHLEKGARR
jgi:hypothetical protein